MSTRRQEDIKRIEANKEQMIKDFAAMAVKLSAYERDLFIMLEEDLSIPEAVTEYLESIYYYSETITEPKRRKEAAEVKELADAWNIKVHCPFCKKKGKIDSIEFEEFGDGFDPDGTEFWTCYGECHNSKCSTTVFYNHFKVITHRPEEEEDQE